MDDHDTNIVSRLKDPWKFMFVDMDIAMLGAVIGMCALFAGLNTFFVVALPCGVGYLVHKSRESKAKGFLRHFGYWHLPPLVVPMKRTPPPYTVRTIG
jgi:type IV conjugative transfer system protein TraL